MAAVSRRPRPALYAALAISLIAAACSLVKPEETQTSKQERAARLVRDGKHAEAARAYADLAVQDPADNDNYELLSAEQWVAAGDVASAKQALGQVSPAARTKLPTPRALVAAEVAYAENDAARAIRELDQIPVPTLPDQAQNYYWIRGRSAFMTGHPLEGVRALVERERFLTDPALLRANREELFAKVRAAAERGISLKPPAKTDPIVAGWLELGPVALELERNPARAAAALENWKRQYPQHPAAAKHMASRSVTASSLPTWNKMRRRGRG
jgi:outer membrane PBP1 activator LpoA protein